MTVLHSTPDWDETTCGLSIWDEIQDGHDVVPESLVPVKTAHGDTLCEKCCKKPEGA